MMNAATKGLSVCIVFICMFALASCEGSRLNEDPGAPINAASQDVLPEPQTEYKGENANYYWMDLAIVNSMIDNNGLPWTKASTGGDRVPGDWDGVIWSEDAANRRVTVFDVQGLELSGALDVSGLTALTELDCSSNMLSALDISGLSALERLDCHGNEIEALDVSDMPELKGLYCFDNNLAELEMQRCSSLEIIYCYNNELTELDASGMGKLAEFNCSSNEITALDVSGCSNLGILICTDNAMDDESAVTGVNDTLFDGWGNEKNMSPFLFGPQSGDVAAEW